MINIKVRFKNWSFWISLIIAIFTPIFAYFGLTASDITTWDKFFKLLLDAISNPYVVLTILVSVYNAVIDPTTKGIKDSIRALSYTVPSGEESEDIEE